MTFTSVGGRLCAAILVGAALGGCAGAPPRVVAPPPSYANFSTANPCSYVGRCVDVEIGGQPVTVIANEIEQKRIAAEVRAADPAAARDVYWRLERPIDGMKALDIVPRMNALGVRFLGEDKDDSSILIYPLDGQDLESREELSTSRNVRANGQAVVTQQNALTSKRLPPGRYVFTIRYYGTRGWDLKAIFLTVQ